MLFKYNMVRNLDKRIFWPQHPPGHIYQAPVKPYPGIVMDWDIHPLLCDFENELLWILNEPFDPKVKESKLALSIQHEVRRWADRWIEEQDPTSLSNSFNKRLESFCFKVEFTKREISDTEKSRFIPPFSYNLIPKTSKEDPASFWLFCLAYTLSKWSPKGLGKCDVCGSYFIDIFRRGKSRCSQKCTSLVATRKLIAKRKQHT